MGSIPVRVTNNSATAQQGGGAVCCRSCDTSERSALRQRRKAYGFASAPQSASSLLVSGKAQDIRRRRNTRISREFSPHSRGFLVGEALRANRPNALHTQSVWVRIRAAERVKLACKRQGAGYSPKAKFPCWVVALFVLARATQANAVLCGNAKHMGSHPAEAAYLLARAPARSKNICQKRKALLTNSFHLAIIKFFTTPTRKRGAGGSPP